MYLVWWSLDLGPIANEFSTRTILFFRDLGSLPGYLPVLDPAQQARSSHQSGLVIDCAADPNLGIASFRYCPSLGIRIA
jgi:hypothetical protein